MAEGPHDALVSRNSATYKTSHSADVASGTVARRLRIDVYDNANDDDNDDNDNA